MKRGLVQLELSLFYLKNTETTILAANSKYAILSEINIARSEGDNALSFLVFSKWRK